MSVVWVCFVDLIGYCLMKVFFFRKVESMMCV